MASYGNILHIKKSYVSDTHILFDRFVCNVLVGRWSCCIPVSVAPLELLASLVLCCRPTGGRTDAKRSQGTEETHHATTTWQNSQWIYLYIYIYNIYGIVASIYIIYWLWRKSCTYIDNNITTFSLSRCWIFGFPTIYIYTKKFILRSWWTDRLLILVKIVGNIYNIVSLLLLHLLLLL